MELYNHIAQEEVDKVKEQVVTKREWQATQIQACQTTPKHLAAPVTCVQIRAEAKVRRERDGGGGEGILALIPTDGVVSLLRIWKVFATLS